MLESDSSFSFAYLAEHSQQKVFSAHLHMDEATPHLHIDFVPFTTGSKRGLDTRVSLKQALAAQGFKGGSRGDTEWSQWVRSEYELVGDYYLPCLKLPEEEQRPVGVWGQRHLRYLKQHRKVLYTNLLTSGKLDSYLADIGAQAEDMFLRLVKQIAKCEGVTEQLKAENQIE